MDQIRNQKVFKYLLPYLAIFVVSLTFAGFKYTQDIAGGASASDNYDIQIRAIRTPLNTTDQWEWNIATSNKKPSSTNQLNYRVNWCSESQGVYGTVLGAFCQNMQNVKFLNELTHGTLTTNVPEAIHTIKHQSVDCGRIEIIISEGSEMIKSTIQDTGKKCSSKVGFGNFSTTDKNNTELSAIQETYCNFYKCEGEVDPTPMPSAAPGEGGSASEPGQPIPPVPKNNEKGLTLSCPISNGDTFVGSLWTPVNNYGHCDARYTSIPALNDNCRGGRAVIWGTAYGIDVHGNYGQQLYLPTINGQRVQWLHYDETPSAVSPGQSIHRYKTNFNGETLALQYHHGKVATLPPVGTSISSGTIGTMICTNCNLNPSHVHIQIKLGSAASGQNSHGWVDAGKFLNCLNL